MSTALPTVLSDFIPMPRALSNTRTRDAVLVLGGALFTALSAQIVVHLGFTPVPLTGQTFAVLSVGSALGARRAMASQFVYWLLGAIGLPFYANASGGWEVASGATAGYFVGFVLAAGIVGWFADNRQDRNFMTSMSAMALSMVVVYLFGAAWLAHSLNVPIATGTTNALSLGVTPFLVGDIIKMVLAGLVGPVGWALYHLKPR
jgi:biotin transport system substrate-specific component